MRFLGRTLATVMLSVSTVAPAAQAQPALRTLGPSDTCVQQQAERTLIGLDAEHALALPPGWELAQELPADRSLLLRAHDTRWSLDAGERELRAAYVSHDHGWAGGWSADRRTFFDGVGPAGKLVAIDVETGGQLPLTDLPARISDLEFHRSLDPAPTPGARGVIVDEEGGVVWFLARDWTHDEALSAQARTGRIHGSALLAAALDGSGTVTLARGLPAAPNHDIALAPRRLFLPRDLPGRVEVRNLTGNLLRTLETPFRSIARVALAPSGTRLVVEQGMHSEALEVDEQAAHDTHSMRRRSVRGGFVVIDIETGEIVARRETGSSCSWSPDGASMACRIDAGLGLFSLEAGTWTTLARVVPTVPSPDSHGSTVAGPPAWSPDGRWLASVVGRYESSPSSAARDFRPPTVLLDLQARRVIVLDAIGYDLAWSTSPRPFVAD